MTIVNINGRFLTRRSTGVDRFAYEVLNAIDHLHSTKNAILEGISFQVLLPARGSPTNSFRNIPFLRVGQLDGHAWEQFELPRYARGQLLVNMCNTAPLFHKNQATIIHDVAPARVPHSYGRLFRAWYRFMTPIIYSGSASICTVSHFSREELSSLFGVRPDICVLPEGTDHMHRIKADPSVLDRHNLRQRPYVFAVSSLAAHKNFSAVGRAIHLLGDPGFDVAVAGAENPKVFGHAGEDLPPFIRKLGYVSDAELKALYENAGCFIFPSIYEGFGLPPVEAMSCGCPVIASNAASIPEVCGQAAQYFDPFDAGMLADTLRRVMADSRLRAQMRLDGLRRAADLRWEASALALLQEIRRIDF